MNHCHTKPTMIPPPAPRKSHSQFYDIEIGQWVFVNNPNTGNEDDFSFPVFDPESGIWYHPTN
jgi:hypothetical protein